MKDAARDRDREGEREAEGERGDRERDRMLRPVWVGSPESVTGWTLGAPHAQTPRRAPAPDVLPFPPVCLSLIWLISDSD